MPASRSNASQKNSMLIALVIFVVLFLVSAVFAVIFYMNNETKDKQKNTAVEELAEIASGRDVAMLKRLVKRGPGGSSVPAIKRITADMNYMAALVAGQDMTTVDLVGIRTMIENETTALWPKLENALTDPAEADRSLGLIRIIESVIDEKDTWLNLYLLLESEMAARKLAFEQRLNTLADEIDQINARLATASRAAQTAEEKYNNLSADLTKRYEDIIDTRDRILTEAQDEEKEARTENKHLKRELERALDLNKDYNKQLKTFYPDPETEMIALEPDGHVVSVAMRDRVAYIDLAQDDHIYPGLTFSVYDSFDTIPKSGKGKATLRVVEILDSISKCRITRDDATNPIMEKDVIASLIWSRDEKYDFCVAGEFDMDEDGYPDPDGRRKISEIITNWGGQVHDTVNVDTDFFVVGASPRLPPRPTVEQLDLRPELQDAYEAAMEKAKAFKAVEDNAARLGVPTFPLSRFLYFIGEK